MFNNELKERFLRESNQLESKQRVYRSIFESTSKFEEEWGADLCTLSKDEAQTVVNNIAGIRNRSTIVITSMLRKYVTWCVENNIPNATRSMFGINNCSVDRIKTQMVASPMHLQRYLDAVCEPEDSKTISNVYRCYYWLAYAGVPARVALQLRTSHIDLLHRIVKYNDSEYPIYEQAVPAFENCINLYAFVRNNPLYNSDTESWAERGAGDNLLRGSNPVTQLSTIQISLSRLSKKAIESGRTEIKLSYNRVMLSGIFFREYERERAGFPVNFKSLAVDSLKEKNLKNGKDEITSRQISTLASNYRTDYRRWKEAFTV